MTKTDLLAMSAVELETLRKWIGEELLRRQNLSGMKPDMVVRHRNGLFDRGVIVGIAKEGKRAEVRYECSGGRFTRQGFIKVELLEVVSEKAGEEDASA